MKYNVYVHIHAYKCLYVYIDMNGDELMYTCIYINMYAYTYINI
jgi:hypothetical protein